MHVPQRRATGNIEEFEFHLLAVRGDVGCHPRTVAGVVVMCQKQAVAVQVKHRKWVIVLSWISRPGGSMECPRQENPFFGAHFAHPFATLWLIFGGYTRKGRRNDQLDSLWHPLSLPFACSAPHLGRSHLIALVGAKEIPVSARWLIRRPPNGDGVRHPCGAPHELDHHGYALARVSLWLEAIRRKAAECCRSHQAKACAAFCHSRVACHRRHVLRIHCGRHIIFLEPARWLCPGGCFRCSPALRRR